MVILKLKDELRCKTIQVFMGLKLKMDSILRGGKQKISANGVTQNAQRRLTHDLYKEVLQSVTHLKTIKIRIR